MTICVVLSTQRSGSTLLVDYLSSDDRILIHSELFQRLRPDLVGRPEAPRHYAIAYETYRGASLRRRLAHALFRRRTIHKYLDETLGGRGDVPVVGMKLMYNQARTYPEVMAWLTDHGARFIHLIRENVLRNVVSRELAKKRGSFSMLKTFGADKITLDPARLEKQLAAMEHEIAFHRHLCSTLNSLETSYERFVASKAEETERILSFLGLPRAGGLRTSLVKTNPNRLEDTIENYDEVAEALAGTRYERYL